MGFATAATATPAALDPSPQLKALLEQPAGALTPVTAARLLASRFSEYHSVTSTDTGMWLTWGLNKMTARSARADLPGVWARTSTAERSR